MKGYSGNFCFCRCATKYDSLHVCKQEKWDAVVCAEYCMPCPESFRTRVKIRNRKRRPWARAKPHSRAAYHSLINVGVY